MKRDRMPRLVIFGDTRKAQVAEAVEEFSNFAKGKADIIGHCGRGECSLEIVKRSDFAVVFGGDGAIISAARSLSCEEVPIIGVNVGKLGFLAEFSVEELKELFGEIVGGSARVEKRMLLACKVTKGGEERFESMAVNDVFITAGSPFRAIELQMCVDGQSLAGCVSDGLIIATPTGSTAYNLSAGGPILSGEMHAIVVTPICPHSLSFRPIVIDDKRRLEVVGVRLNEGTTLSIDGQVSCKLTMEDVVHVERHKGVFRIVNNPLRSQWDTLATKLRWAEKPNYKKM